MSPEEAKKVTRGLENLGSEDRMRELGLSSLEKESSRETLELLPYVKGPQKKAGEGFFTRSALFIFCETFELFILRIGNQQLGNGGIQQTQTSIAHIFIVSHHLRHSPCRCWSVQE
ncbi:hypothetical protein TURU_006019 [Turdus rufiventris]|nr:hypothetical protein TURU_006019 [Turdus rufiventris]